MRFLAGMSLFLVVGTARADGVPQVPSVPLVPALPRPPRRTPKALVDVSEEGDVRFRDAPRTGECVLAGIVGFLTFMGSASPQCRCRGEAREGQLRADYVRTSFARRARQRREVADRRLQAALYELGPTLETIWSDARVSHEERRRRLFDLWDEWIEDGPGRVARATVIGFIRRRLPRGSPHAYSTGELYLLNMQRLSAETFDPYGSPYPRGLKGVHSRTLGR